VEILHCSNIVSCTTLGGWSGLIYEAERYTITLSIRIDDNYGIGSSEYRTVGSNQVGTFYASWAEIIGNVDAFSMHLQVGGEYNLPWYYTGRVDNEGRLCLRRDVLPEPERCLAPME
jgi:hypothetical protein